MAPSGAMHPRRLVKFLVYVHYRAGSVSKSIRKVSHEKAEAKSPETIVQRCAEKHDNQSHRKNQWRKRQRQRADELENFGAVSFCPVDRERHDDSCKDGR